MQNNIRPQLRARVTNQELNYFQNLLTSASQSPDLIAAKEAVTLFQRSGVQLEKLKEIWQISARTSNEYLSKEEFFVALRLIAYA